MRLLCCQRLPFCQILTTQQVSSLMNFVFGSDLHSSESHYYALRDTALERDADAIVLGGDLFRYSRDPRTQVSFCREFVVPWIRGLDRPVAWIPGNTDWEQALSPIRSACDEGAVELSHTGSTYVAGVRFVGYGFTPLGPFRIKHREKRDRFTSPVCLPEPSFVPSSNGELRTADMEWAADLGSIEDDLSGLPDAEIWVMHCPPANTRLDCVRATDDVQAVTHCGSLAIRAAIERRQPALVLCGHAHESPDECGAWHDTLGASPVVNPGRVDQPGVICFSTETSGRVWEIEHTRIGERFLLG